MLFPYLVSRPSANSSSSSPSPSHQLYLEARARCVQLLPRVSRIIRHHLLKESGNYVNLFTWDTGLVRDGCFFAGLLSVSLHGDLHCLDGHDVKLEESDDCITPEEGVNLCLAALAEMRWVFSKSDERMEAIRLALKNSKERQKSRSESPKSSQASSSVLQPTSSRVEPSIPSEKPVHPCSHNIGLEVVTNASDRHPLHLNIILPTPRQVESPPNTAYSTDGTTANGWPIYTPPTASSPSNEGSPYMHEKSPGSYKSNHDDSIFYHVSEALEHFANTDTMDVPIIAHALYQSQNTFFNAHDAAEPPIHCLSPSLLTSTEVDSYLDGLYP